MPPTNGTNMKEMKIYTMHRWREIEIDEVKWRRSK
jgi:hypothetical protein